jgi:hypothetical protein
MANAEQQKQSQPDPQQSGQPQQAAAAPPQPRKGSTGPAVFGDGSTQEQQDRLVREAEEANAATKRYADTEREARSQ